MRRLLLKLNHWFGLAGIALACALNSCPVSAQRIPSCSDADVKQKMTALIARWLQNQLDISWNTEIQTGIAPARASKPTVLRVVILSAIQTPFIGYTPCVIAGQTVTQNNQNTAMVPFDMMIIKVAYDNNDNLVLEMLDGFR